MNLISETRWNFCGFLCTFVNFSGDVTKLQIGVKRVFLNYGSMVNFNYQVRLLARSNDFNKITIFGFGVGKLSSDFLGTKFAISIASLHMMVQNPQAAEQAAGLQANKSVPRFLHATLRLGRFLINSTC